MESISWTSNTSSTVACAAPAYQGGTNTTVTITNITGLDWDDVWFVADGEIDLLGAPILTNADALVGKTTGGSKLGLAFRIDNTAVNRPLIRESLNSNLIFEAGESWVYIVQEWGGTAGLGGNCSAVFGSGSFGSLGVGGVSCNNAASNASIVAHLLPEQVPEPGTLALLAFGLAGLGFARRKLAA